MDQYERELAGLTERVAKANERETATMQSALLCENTALDGNERRVRKPFSVIDFGTGAYSVHAPYGSLFIVPEYPKLTEKVRETEKGEETYLEANAVVEVPVIAGGPYADDGTYYCVVRKDELGRPERYTGYIELGNEGFATGIAHFPVFSLDNGNVTQLAFGAVVMSEASGHQYYPKPFEVFAVVDGYWDHPTTDGSVTFKMYAPRDAVWYEGNPVQFANASEGYWISLTAGYGQYWCWLGVQEEPNAFKAYVGKTPPEFPEAVKFPVCELSEDGLPIAQLSIGIQDIAQNVHFRAAPFRVFPYTRKSDDTEDGWENGLKMYIPPADSLYYGEHPLHIEEAEGSWYYLDLNDTSTSDVWWCTLSNTGEIQADGKLMITAHIVKGKKAKESVGFPVASLTENISTLSAVVVGLEDSLTAGNRPGANIDVENMSKILSRDCDVVTVLQNEAATKEKVVEALENAIESTDFVVFYISCHGGNNGGGQNFCCLYDGYLHDFEIWERIKKVRGKCWLIFDCCHSRTMANIPDGYSGEASFLSWASCPDDTYGWTTSNGSFFTNSIVRHYSRQKLYQGLFDETHADPSVVAMEDTQKVEAGTGFVNKEVLT